MLFLTSIRRKRLLPKRNLCFENIFGSNIAHDFHKRHTLQSSSSFFATQHFCSSGKTGNENDEDKSFLSKNDLRLALQAMENKSDSNSFSDIPGAEKGGKKLAIIYTCKVCNTRSAKKFTQQSYEKGLVMVRCPNCKNLHLIADRLGVFDDSKDGWDIETYLRSMGDKVKTVTNDNVLEITMADIMGKEET